MNRLNTCFLILLLIPVFALADSDGAHTSQPPAVESGTLHYGGGSLFYERSGEGETLLLLHDGILHRETWDGIFDALAKNHDVVRYDRRGYGRSDKPAGPYDNVEDLMALLEHLGVDRAAVAGVSAGASLAVDFTIAYPKKVTRLILLSPVVRGLAFTPHFSSRGGHAGVRELGYPSASRAYWFSKDPYILHPESDEAKKRAAALLYDNPHNLDPGNLMLLTPSDQPAVGELSGIRVPTLILTGEADIPDVHAHAGALQAGIPGARRMVLETCGHLLQLEKTEEVAVMIRDFLYRIDLFHLLETGGPDRALEVFRTYGETEPEKVVFDEDTMNDRGARLLRLGRTEEAVKVFTLNTLGHPDSWHVYDSLGEALLVAGEKAAALDNFRKSLSINPDNVNAEEQIEAAEQ